MFRKGTRVRPPTQDRRDRRAVRRESLAHVVPEPPAEAIAQHMAGAGTKSWSGSFPFHGPRQAQPPLSSASNIARLRTGSNDTRGESSRMVREARSLVHAAALQRPPAPDAAWAKKHAAPVVEPGRRAIYQGTVGRHWLPIARQLTACAARDCVDFGSATEIALGCGLRIPLERR